MNVWKDFENGALELAYAIEAAVSFAKPYLCLRLQNKVIDLEVAASTPSPTVDPSVHTILVGHSMGGIVAAETLLLLANDHSVSSSSTSRTPGNTAAKSTEDLSNANAENAYAGVSHDQTGSETSLLFPYVKGILAFDTPFLGISPGLIAHGAEDQYRTMSSAYKTLSGVSSAFGWQGRGTNKSPSTPTISTARGKDKRPAGVLPPAESQIDAAAVPKWQSWGKYAMYAGAAGAIAAGGAAALYSQKDKINFGWNWVSDHLVFVGSLLRAEELKQRIKKVGKVASSNSIGLANCYTALGKAALEAPETSKNSSEEVKRTFARLPPGKVEEGQVEVDADGFRWMMAKNNKARDEISAHVSMFYPKDNPGYYNLGQTAKALILQWIDGKWYEESQDPADVRSDGKKPTVVAEDKWKQHDWEDEFSGQKEREKSSGPQEGWEDGTGGDGDDVRMRDELTTGNEVEDLESSVLVDKAL